MGSVPVTAGRERSSVSLYRLLSLLNIVESGLQRFLYFNPLDKTTDLNFYIRHQQEN
jgi:hypothetical protein